MHESLLGSDPFDQLKNRDTSRLATSVAMARLGPLVARLKQLSRICGSGSQAELISMAVERLRAAQSGLAVQI